MPHWPKISTVPWRCNHVGRMGLIDARMRIVLRLIGQCLSDAINKYKLALIPRQRIENAGFITAEATMRQDDRNAGILAHISQPIDRIARIQRHVRGTGFERTQ